MGKIVSKIFVPSKRFGYILGTILLLVLVISFFDFPFEIFSMTSLDGEMTFSVGWPVTFFEIDLLNTNGVPIKWGAFIVSFVGYAFVAYVFDVLISLAIFLSRKQGMPEETLVQARKAYHYYKNQGLSEDKIKDLFIKKGWKEGEIENLK